MRGVTIATKGIIVPPCPKPSIPAVMFRDRIPTKKECESYLPDIKTRFVSQEILEEQFQIKFMEGIRIEEIE